MSKPTDVPAPESTENDNPDVADWAAKYAAAEKRIHNDGLLIIRFSNEITSLDKRIAELTQQLAEANGVIEEMKAAQKALNIRIGFIGSRLGNEARLLARAERKEGEAKHG